MEQYFCIFSDLGTIRKDFNFKNPDEYFNFISANKSSIVWAKLIDLQTGETVDEYRNLNSIDFSTTKINIPENLMESSDSLLLINQQQLVWLTKFAKQETPKAFNSLNNDPIKAYSIPAKSSLYNAEPMHSGLTIVDQTHFRKLIGNIMRECKTDYKKRLFKLMVNAKGFEIVVKTNPLI